MEVKEKEREGERESWACRMSHEETPPHRPPPTKKKTGKYDGEEQEKEDGGQKNYEKNETKEVRKGGERVDTGKGAVKIQSFQQESTEFHVSGKFPNTDFAMVSSLSSGFTALTSCLVCN